jgi:hypothetical protein
MRTSQDSSSNVDPQPSKPNEPLFDVSTVNRSDTEELINRSDMKKPVNQLDTKELVNRSEEDLVNQSEENLINRNEEELVNQSEENLINWNEEELVNLSDAKGLVNSSDAKGLVNHSNGILDSIDLTDSQELDREQEEIVKVQESLKLLQQAHEAKKETKRKRESQFGPILALLDEQSIDYEEFIVFLTRKIKQKNK